VTQAIGEAFVNEPQRPLAADGFAVPALARVAPEFVV
jgi:hypothetical protein